MAVNDEAYHGMRTILCQEHELSVRVRAALDSSGPSCCLWKPDGEFQTSAACGEGGNLRHVPAMEWILELLVEIAFSADFFALLGDIWCWHKGRANRLERREARRAGESPPRRDKWNRWVIVLTSVAMILTALLVYKLW